MSPQSALKPEDKPGLAPHVRLQWEEAQDAWVVLYPKGNIKLNESAGDILKRCTGDKTVTDIIAELRGEYGDDVVGEDVWGFLGIACERKWIEPKRSA